MAVCSSCGIELPAGARFCPSCAEPVESDADHSERKLATMVFADLVGSTALGGDQGPERTRRLLSGFFAAMAEEIDLAGGTVEKFAGDAVMAAFGVPAALEDHAERALHAAIGMQRRMRDEFGDSLAIRIGVNTGEVVVGPPLEGSSFVTGDAVNAAARLEQAAGPGDILVGERTVASVRGAFEFADPESVPAKGFPDGLPARRLLRSLSLMRPRGVLGLQRAFVGRDEEMAVLTTAYDQVVDDRAPRLVTILGDAGVGKSRIVREFWEQLGGRQPEPLRRTGRCLAYGEATTYWPLAEVLKEHLEILEGETAAGTLERLGPRPILGMTLGMDVGSDLHPLVARDQLQDAWVAFVEEISADRPLVILVEDIHWADDLLLDLLERLVGDADCPLLLVVTARPEIADLRPRWGAVARGFSITLEPLAAAESREMLTDLLGMALPPGLDAVVERAEGNPFFVEELLGTLIDRRLLERTNGTWRLAELPPGFEVPDTVQAVVSARMDLLGTAEKEALQAASVIGRIFWAEPVYELVAEHQPDLRILEERDFIRRRLGSSMVGQREYAIKHALTREVAYDGIPRARRAAMHARFARWAEATSGSPDELAPILAHHYAEAVRPEDLDLAWPGREAEAAELRVKAVGWLQRAAQLAIGRMEVDDAISLLHRAIGLEPDAQERALLWREVGRANILRFDGEAFWTSMQAALELNTHPDIAADIYGELAIQTQSRRGMWMRRPGDELIEGWLSSALELAKPGTRARAKALIAKVLLSGDPDLAVEAAALAEELGDADLKTLAWRGLEGVALDRGDFPEAFAWSKRIVDLASVTGDPDLIAYFLGNAAGTWPYVGRIAEARDHALRMVEIARRLSPHHRIHGAVSVVAVDAMAGDWPAVRAYTAEAEAAFNANRATPCILGPIALLICAEAAVRLGDDDEGARLERVVEDFGMEGYAMMTIAYELSLATARGDLDALASLLDDWVPDTLGNIEDQIAWLNGLILLDRRAEIEATAPALVIKGTYLEPFALRALAFARGDDGLYEQAIAAFQGMDLEWFAAQTRHLQAEGRLSSPPVGAG
jgi:class 3 adenylate cyclase/tetratricopeptide (TPR) repeat protein